MLINMLKFIPFETQKLQVCHHNQVCLVAAVELSQHTAEYCGNWMEYTTVQV